MFYFTKSFTFWNKLQKNELFHDILIFWDAPVHKQTVVLFNIFVETDTFFILW